ncbi:MAG TPA: MFS transporter [Alphaproteobacteria bacterium]|nr:MFS transporter [Alphaproteobacteria bacterium]
MTQVSKSVPSIPLSIWALGSVSFLMKVSSVIVFSLTPLFVTEVLGGSSSTVGLLESFVEAITLSSRIFSGILSDIIHKRKNIIIVGYILALISRIILGISLTIEGVFLGRAFDRVGNGLDATPRDALVGDLAPPQIKGACYGLRESLSRAGAFSGSLLAIALLWLTQNNYSLLYWLAAIPTVLALVVLITFVKDPVSEKFEHKRIKNKPKFTDILNLFNDIFHLPLIFWLTLLLSGIFMLSNFSGAFLILRIRETGIDIHLIPLVMVVQNFATALTAYPVGYLSDRMGRRSMMALGIFLVILSNLLLAIGGSTYIVLGGVFLWGAEMGITLSILAIFLADACPKDFRGTGFGLFHLVNGICLILSNFLSGQISVELGPSYMFYTSAIIAACSSLVLPFIHKKTK